MGVPLLDVGDPDLRAGAVEPGVLLGIGVGRDDPDALVAAVLEPVVQRGREGNPLARIPLPAGDLAEGGSEGGVDVPVVGGEVDGSSGGVVRVVHVDVHLDLLDPRSGEVVREARELPTPSTTEPRRATGVETLDDVLVRGLVA